MSLQTALPMTLASDAPPPGACVRVERPEPGLAVLVLDPPHRSLAVLDLPLMRDLGAALERLAADEGLEGLVVTGREPTSFAAGADLETLEALEDAAVATELARFGQRVFQRLADLRARTVAAVGGPVPGGACELALACDRIVLAKDPRTRIGLPEVKLGILPGWGGTQRLPRRLGVTRALEAILSGRLHAPKLALRIGLVDRLAWPQDLLRVAGNVAMGRESLPGPRRGAQEWLVDRNPLALALVRRKVEAEIARETGGHYPAPGAAAELVLAAPRTPLEEGLEREARALGRLAVSPVCKNLVRIFRMSEEAKRLARLPDGSEAPAVRRAGVVGAGVMGAAIAGLMAEKGVAVRLSDVARAPLDAALVAHRRRVRRDLERRRIERHEAEAALDRLEVGTGLAGFARCELVVEAVAERVEVKRSVFAELARQVAKDTGLATNTSSLSVDRIAEGLEGPARFTGMHFFNPVHRMPLVEVVRGSRSSAAALARTARLALQLGKTPVVVLDVAGFLVNRVLAPYLDEAARVLEERVDPLKLERVAKAFGMPMGPLELLDEIGFDVAVHAARSLEEAYGARMRPSPVLARMLEAGLKGKKGGAGFYLYAEPKGGGRPEKQGLNSDLGRFLGTKPARSLDISEQGIVDQLVLSMLNEAARALEEQVVAGPRELDLATVFGMGFPPFRGGLLRYADARGLRDVVDTLRRTAAAPDVLARNGGRERFQPAPLLLELAGRGGCFHSA
ncbi:MAG TPA: 3-hydroxyacyl-CoA dehydrogenase NAD-binding domain-containing protein [Planctomycetota bacterium]|nr:3-hydroxyacyl-CoA dehydrogenase NAD-binding domain-containing protein [Planctomycetota bacterium]